MRRWSLSVSLCYGQWYDRRIVSDCLAGGDQHFGSALAAAGTKATAAALRAPRATSRIETFSSTDIAAVHGSYIASSWDFYKPDLTSEYVRRSRASLPAPQMQRTPILALPIRKVKFQWLMHSPWWTAP